MTQRGRIWRVALVCTKCGEPFIRYAMGVIPWNGKGGEGWYYDEAEAAWCGACRVGWGEQKGNGQ